MSSLIAHPKELPEVSRTSPEVQSMAANQDLRVKVLISLSHLLAWLEQGLHASDWKLLF